ncbi:MAG: Cell division protein DivIB [bacterium ADurb.Bin243]|nr:MAG: Cell division protein DivIB [bacterium ADurb.Bin243]
MDLNGRKWINFKKLLRFSRNFFVVILTVFLFLLAVWEFKYLIFETSYFELKKISIEGNYTIEKEKILALSGFKLSENFLKLNYRNAEKRLRAIPKIKDVEIITEGVGEVLIRITERESVLLVLHDRKFYELDAEGYILSASNKNVRVDLPILTGVAMPLTNIGESVRAEIKIKSVINWIVNLAPAFLTNISEICLNGNEIVLITNNGIKIYPGNASNFKNNFELLTIVLERFQKDGMKISYVDMRFNNEVVVKPITN